MKLNQIKFEIPVSTRPTINSVKFLAQNIEAQPAISSNKLILRHCRQPNCSVTNPPRSVPIIIISEMILTVIKNKQRSEYIRKNERRSD